MKKAILVVSFGTSYKKSREKAIEACEKRLCEAFPEYDFYRAYTSNGVIKKISEIEGLQIDITQQALERIYRLGYEKLLIQSLHIICGAEYDGLKEQVLSYRGYFKELSLGRPLLAQKEDYKKVIEAIKYQLPPLKEKEGVVFVGHGTTHEADTTFTLLTKMLGQEEQPLYMMTLKDQKRAERVLNELRKREIKRVYLIPFLLAAGNHVIRDIAGEAKHSWQSILSEQGIEARVDTRGLGENPCIQEQFVQHAKEALKAPIQ